MVLQPNDGGEKTVTTTIRIPESILEQVKQLAKRRERSMNYVLVELIRTELKRRTVAE